MSVAVFDDDFIIHIHLSSERYFVSFWEKAIEECGLELIGNGRYIRYRDLSGILAEIRQVRDWTEKNVSGEHDRAYIFRKIEYILTELPEQWNVHSDISELYMG